MNSKLQLDGLHHKSVLAPSGERLRGKGRRQAWCNLQVNCVIHAWAPCVYYKNERYINPPTFTFYLF